MVKRGTGHGPSSTTSNTADSSINKMAIGSSGALLGEDVGLHEREVRVPPARPAAHARMPGPVGRARSHSLSPPSQPRSGDPLQP